MKNILYKFTKSNYRTLEYHDQTTLFDPSSQAGVAPFKIKQITKTKEDFLKNYGNIICRVEEDSVTIVVEEYDDKISIKLFNKKRVRYVGNRFFQVTKTLNYLTVNTRTKNIYYGALTNYHKKTKRYSMIRKNFFVNSPMNIILNRANTILRLNFATTNNQEILSDICNSFFKKLLTNYNHVKNYNPDEFLFKYYLEQRNIKYPNNFMVFKNLFNTDGVSKILKKNLKNNDNRLVDSIMKTFNLRGDIIKKTLHNINEFDYSSYETCVSFFGDKVKQDYDILLTLFNNNIKLPVIDNNFSKKENNKIYKIFKEFVLTKKIHNTTFIDHLFMYQAIKNYGETDLQWQSDSLLSFKAEHLDWTEKISNYRTGTYERIYPETIKKGLKPIEDSGFIYYPILLETSKDYNLESSIQSNCVRTYINKTSIIISLRQGSIDSEERATLEYHIKKDNDNLKINRIQSLGKHNSLLDQNWDKPLNKLDDIVNKWLKKEFTYSIVKKSNNGRETFSEINLSGETINWDNKEIYEGF